ncbi:MAG: PP2C family protein-serine/threonine phosphatase [Phycisphaerales bacterium]
MNTTATPLRYRRVDLSPSMRVPVLMGLVEQLSRATEPTEVQRVFARGIRQLNPVDGFISVSCRGLAAGTYKITRMSLDPDALVNNWGDPWRNFASMPTHTGGLIGELIANDQPKLLQQLDVRDDPVLDHRIAGFGSLIAVPLFDNGHALNWAISLRRSPEGFSLEDLEEGILRGNLVGGTVRTVVLAKQLRDANARIQDEVERIARIQQALLPERMPEIPGVSLASSYATFDVAGGDLYTFRPVFAVGERDTAPPESPWAMMIADASGHGPSAAVVSAMVHSIVHAYPEPPTSPAVLLRHVNRHLAAKRIEQSFVTAFAAIYDPTSRKLLFSRAGHEPPILKNSGSGGATVRLDAAGHLPLGILEDVQYTDAEIALEPGQTVVMYTDGITEARSPSGAMFGVEGIERSLVECSGEPQCVIGSITGALREHEAGQRPADDQTIVTMKVVGA